MSTLTRLPELVINPNILAMEYAVRGPIPQRAAALRGQGRSTIPCNIGNPQALGQPPLAYFRQLLGLVEVPGRIARERRLNALWQAGRLDGVEADDLVNESLLARAEDYLRQLESGMGAYTDSTGPVFVREAIAAFIDRRDGADGRGRPFADPGQIFLTDGASEAARSIIEMLVADPSDGIMIPIPQYPLYSATIRKVGGVQVDYYLDEEAGWSLDRAELEASLAAARAQGVRVKAIVAINPGNPTGAILDQAGVDEIVDFAAENGLLIIADEVYQENVYGARFVSFAQRVGDRPVPLVSLHSISKGFVGECGHRGGYMEIRNPPPVAGGTQNLVQVATKQASVALCSNTVGQCLTWLMVNPPEAGSEAHRRYVAERQQILDDLHAKATMIRAAFDQMPGVECFGRTGAMYLFPRLGRLPDGSSDFDYCMQLLETTGLTTVNGSGFGQRPGSQHLRIAFLPPKPMLEAVLPAWIDFHRSYVGG